MTTDVSITPQTTTVGITSLDAAVSVAPQSLTVQILDGGTEVEIAPQVISIGLTSRTTQVSIESTSIDVSLSGTGPQGPAGPQGPIGPQGPAGDLHFTHTQDSSSTAWIVSHNLGKFPSVTVVDSGGNLVIGDVDYADANNLTILFSVPFSGNAYLN